MTKKKKKTTIYFYPMVLDGHKCNLLKRVQIVAHLLARHAKNVSHDVNWMEGSPPAVVQALYLNSISI